MPWILQIPKGYFYRNSLYLSYFQVDNPHIVDTCNFLCEADFIPPSENGSNSISVGTAFGIAVAAAILIILVVVGILQWKGCFRPENTLERGSALIN